MDETPNAKIDADLDNPEWPYNQSQSAKALQRLEDVLNATWYAVKAVHVPLWICAILLALLLWRVW